MLASRPVRPACHPVRANVAGYAGGADIGVGEEVGVNIDELLVVVGDAHDERLVCGRHAETAAVQAENRPGQISSAVIEFGSFDATAERLHVTPSAVSQRIKAAEQRVDQVLV